MCVSESYRLTLPIDQRRTIQKDSFRFHLRIHVERARLITTPADRRNGKAQRQLVGEVVHHRRDSHPDWAASARSCPEDRLHPTVLGDRPCEPPVGGGLKELERSIDVRLSCAVLAHDDGDVPHHHSDRAYGPETLYLDVTNHGVTVARSASDSKLPCPDCLTHVFADR